MLRNRYRMWQLLFVNYTSILDRTQAQQVNAARLSCSGTGLLPLFELLELLMDD